MSVFLRRLRGAGGLLFFAAGAVLFALGVYTSIFGRVLVVAPVALGLYAVLFAGIILYDRHSWTSVVVDEGLTMLDQDLLALLNKHMQVEEEARRRLESTIDVIEYTPLKLLLTKIVFETEKHEKLLRSMVAQLSRDLRVPSREEYDAQVEAVREALEAHEKTEFAMIQLIEEEMRMSSSRLVRSLLGAIIEDEAAHHETFRRILGRTT